jgi:hypothetical protein
VIFIHFYDMFAYVRPSVSLFRSFHVLRWSNHVHHAHQPWQVGSLERRLGDRMSRHPRSPGATNSGPNGKRSDWEEVLRLHRAYAPVIERIMHQADHNLTSMMVLFDLLSRHIAPLQLRARPTWLYTGEGDTTRLGG